MNKLDTTKAPSIFFVGLQFMKSGLYIMAAGE